MTNVAQYIDFIFENIRNSRKRAKYIIKSRCVRYKRSRINLRQKKKGWIEILPRFKSNIL